MKLFGFNYFWPHWVFIAMRGLSSSCGSLGSNCPMLCGIFPDQGSDQCAVHWQAASSPVDHQEVFLFLFSSFQIKLEQTRAPLPGMLILYPTPSCPLLSVLPLTMGLSFKASFQCLSTIVLSLMDFWRITLVVLEIGCDSVPFFLNLSESLSLAYPEYIDFSSFRVCTVSVELKKRLRFSSFLLYVSSVCVAFKQEQYAVSYLKWLSPEVRPWPHWLIQQLDDVIQALSVCCCPCGNFILSLIPEAAVSDTGWEKQHLLTKQQLGTKEPFEKPSSRLHPSLFVWTRWMVNYTDRFSFLDKSYLVFISYSFKCIISSICPSFI